MIEDEMTGFLIEDGEDDINTEILKQAEDIVLEEHTDELRDVYNALMREKAGNE